MRKLWSTLIILMVLSLSVSAQSIVGKWKTIDDETGKPKSVVEIYEKGGKYYGKIVELLLRKDDPKCDQCTDDRKNKKILGMEIIREMKENKTEYSDGTILDPNNGRVYDCKIWIEKDKPDVLLLRGYIAFFYRTQNWERVK
ncbi:MAG: hypothetical protein RIS47_2017 [Bacteroidota bacterium]